MLRLAASRGLRSATRGAVLQQSRRCLVTKFSKVRARTPAARTAATACRCCLSV